MILIRATKLTEITATTADELAAISGEDIAFVLDGRHPVTVTTTRPIIMLTADACSALGLYCPPDFAWRCGDYGLYLARRQFPDVQHFWLIEYDIRIAGGNPAIFFDTFARKPEIDFLACNYRRSGTDWDWYFHASGRDVQTFRCMFGIVRVSVHAIDWLLKKRVAQAKISSRRKLMPNDEGFVATTLSNSGFACADFNDFGQSFYDSKSLSLLNPVKGETFAPATSRPMIYHPVLWGEDFEHGNLSSTPKPKAGFVSILKRTVRRHLNAITKW